MPLVHMRCGGVCVGGELEKHSMCGEEYMLHECLITCEGWDGGPDVEVAVEVTWPADAGSCEADWWP